MATYYVKTRAEFIGSTLEDLGYQSRTIIVEADKFVVNEQTGHYDFHKYGEVSKKAPYLVASVNARDVLGVFEEEAFQADYIAGYSENEPDEDEFFDRVWDIVSLWHDPDPEDLICDECRAAETIQTVQTVPVPDTPVAVPDVSPVIEHWTKGDGADVWGFQTPQGFVDLYDEKSAQECLDTYKKYPDTPFLHKDLTGYTKVED